MCKLLTDLRIKENTSLQVFKLQYLQITSKQCKQQTTSFCVNGIDRLGIERPHNCVFDMLPESASSGFQPPHDTPSGKMKTLKKTVFE